MDEPGAAAASIQGALALAAATQPGGSGHASLLPDIGLCIVAATVLAYLAKLARQPLLLAYLGAGFLIGPIGLGLVSDRASIEMLAELGLAFLMFIVGLEINLRKLLAAGGAAAITTVIQVAGSGAAGYAVAVLLGYGGLPAVYVGCAVAFSSTMIVIKLLADRGELDTLPGRTTLAILLIQDVLAIIALAVQPSLGSGLPLGDVSISILKGVALIGAAMAVSVLILPRLFRWVAMVPEILLLTAMSWCFAVCYAATRLDFSVAMGALIAGVSISALPYTVDVVAKVRPLRDFFVTLFFVSLGMLLVIPSAGLLIHALVLSAVVIASRFLLIWPVLRVLGYDNRLGALSSIHLAQNSEFGLLIVLAGASAPYHHIQPEVMWLVVLVLVMTSAASTYMIQFSHQITGWLVRRSAATPFRDRQALDGADQPSQPADIMLIGCFRVGEALIPKLIESKRDFSVIDFNPRLHAELKERGVRCVYGDISHADTLDHAGVSEARILISSISDDFLRGTDNLTLLRTLRMINPGATIVVTAESPEHALHLYEQGADHVLLTPHVAADHLDTVLDRAGGGDLAAMRATHMAELRKRL